MVCLYIDRKGITLKIANRALVVYAGEDKLTSIPLKLLERLCIQGDLSLSASVLGNLGDNDISVLILRGLQHKPTMLLPSFKQDARRRIIQANLASDPVFCLEFSRVIVQEKLQSQHEFFMKYASKLKFREEQILEITNRYCDWYRKAINAPNTAYLLGLEGSAANQYFQLIARILPKSLQFSGRNRRPPKDPFNVVLSLGYTLLHYEWVRHIYLMGLDPYLGFYHTVHFGRESLACDLLEPQRSLYDDWAISLFKDKVLREEDFKMKGNACEMGKAGRLRFYEAYEVWLQTQQTHFYKTKQLLFEIINGRLAQFPSSFKDDKNIFSDNSLEIRMVTE